MNEYLLYLASAFVSRVVNLSGRFRGAARSPRILIVKLDHFGDVLLATPAIRALRQAHPETPIDVLIARGSAAALEGNDAVTRILHYESRRYRRGGESKSGEPGGYGAMRAIARDGYTTIVELRGDGWTLLLPFLTGARRRVDRGSVRIRNWLARRLTSAERTRGHIHEVETNLEIVSPLLGGAAPDPARTEVHVSPFARDSLTRKLTSAGVDLNATWICIHPAASWKPRAWRPERFAAIADWLQDHYHSQVLFVGSSEEKDVEASVRARVKGRRAFWLAGALTWQELAALLERSRLFIGNDSGPAHLAAAVGAPTLALFGATDHRRFRPWSERTVVLHHPVHCWPCRQTVCLYPENPCVNRIEIDEVEEQVRRILGPPQASG